MQRLDDPVDDLAAFVDASPTPYHAVAEMARRLDAAGFGRLREHDDWSLQPSDRRYVVRDGGSIVAFRIGHRPVADAGFRIVGAHTDSPTFKVRPRHHASRGGFTLTGVETYGGALNHTWLDRDLGIAGRVAVRDGDGHVDLVHVRLDEAVLRIPSLAIHLDRDVNEGLQLNPQQHLVPVAGPDTATDLAERIAAHIGVHSSSILGHDLVTFDVQPAARGGIDGDYLFAGRLDNLSSCHAATTALMSSGPIDATQVVVANDHEEVGSASAEGAAGSFLADVLRRIELASGSGDAQGRYRAAARSILVSCDTAHAVHPNYIDRHEAQHQPRLGGGPVLKVNANQRYATDAGTGGWFTARCADVGVALQAFVTRGDLPCGSTIGPLTATRTGIPTVDVGNPVLSMHSIREQCAAQDIPPLTAALRSHLLSDDPPPGASRT